MPLPVDVGRGGLGIERLGGVRRILRAAERGVAADKLPEVPHPVATLMTTLPNNLPCMKW